MKKEYSKPTIEVLDMEVQQMICQSITEKEYTQPLTNDEGDEGTGDNAWPTFTGVFD